MGIGGRGPAPLGGGGYWPGWGGGMYACGATLRCDRQSPINKNCQRTYAASDPYSAKQTSLRMIAQQRHKLVLDENSRWPLGGGIPGG